MRIWPLDGEIKSLKKQLDLTNKKLRHNKELLARANDEVSEKGRIIVARSWQITLFIRRRDSFPFNVSGIDAMMGVLSTSQLIKWNGGNFLAGLNIKQLAPLSFCSDSKRNFHWITMFLSSWRSWRQEKKISRKPSVTLCKWDNVDVAAVTLLNMLNFLSDKSSMAETSSTEAKVSLWWIECSFFSNVGFLLL